MANAVKDPRSETIRGEARPRILVVGDHPEVLRVVQRQLEQSYRCAFSSRGDETRKMLSSEPFALVLCDIYLRGESGLILAEEIARDFPQTSVVLMTGEDDPKVARRAFEFGAHGYLVKPFGRGQLLITIMNALKRRELEQAQEAHARALQERLQTVIDRAPIPIYAKDRSFRYIFANRSAEENARLGAGELIGLSDETIMSADSAERARSSDLLVLDGGQVYEEQEALLIGGKERTYMTVKFPLLDEAGEIYAICGVSRDITAQKQANQLRDDLANAQAQAIQELRSSRLETVERLAKALELHDPNLGRHVDRMASIAAFLARLIGFDEQRAELLRAAALMHDVGKIGVPARILRKPKALARQERKVMERHPQLGHDLLSGSESELLRLAASIALTHHERYDGGGYPHGLAGEHIPIEGRIAALADVFDALLSDRTYRPALTVPNAVELIRTGNGTQFDPQIAELLLQHLKEVLSLRDNV